MRSALCALAGTVLAAIAVAWATVISAGLNADFDDVWEDQ